jgi:uncharacterized membrane protein YccF (DUF307 family)
VRLILHVLWFIFGSGVVLAIGYGVAAVICFGLIVTIPFEVVSLRLAVYSLWPFGRTIVDRRDAGIASGPANICGCWSSAGGSPWRTSRTGSPSASRSSASRSG